MTEPLKLKDIILNAQYIADIILNHYNEIIGNLGYEHLTSAYALGIGNMVYDYIHVLLPQHLAWLRVDQTSASEMIRTIIAHNTVPLVNEIREMCNVVANHSKLGKSHNKTNFHPFDNTDEEANLTNTDIISYNDLSILNAARLYILKNSTYINKLYDELYDCCVIAYEGC